MKYCDIHGQVDAADDQTTCRLALGNDVCNTVLTDKPSPKWQAEFEKRRASGNELHIANVGAPPVAVDTDLHDTRTRDLQTLRMQGAFLAAYAEMGRIDLAAKAAGIARQTHYGWKRSDSDYLIAFEQAEELASATLLDEAVRRGRDGWDEPITVAGERVVVRKFSDRLLERLLEAKFPLIFRSNLAHRLVDAKDKDRPLFDIAELDKLIKAADERDKEMQK